MRFQPPHRAGSPYDQFVTPIHFDFGRGLAHGQVLLGAEIVLHILTFNQQVTPR
jgi:hypothetical protein